MTNACINECFWRFIWSSLNCAKLRGGTDCRVGALEVTTNFCKAYKVTTIFSS